MSKKISQGKIVVATHYRIYSASQALRDFLRQEKCSKLAYISHPLVLDDSENVDYSYMEISSGKQVKLKKEANWKSRDLLLNTLHETYLTLKWIFESGEKYDLIIGVDNLNALHGLMLKMVGRIDKVVYYTIDHFPQRFENTFMNWLYHFLDKICVKYADETWNVSPVMAQAREKQKGMDRKVYNRQYTVPIGIWFDKAPRKNFNEIDRHKLVFVGHLLSHMGVDLVIQALPEIIKQVPGVTLEVIGGGEEYDKLQKLTRSLSLQKKIKFYGWVRNRKRLERIMSDGAVGMAAFNTEILDEKVKNADPGKIKDYMQMGMPVIVTDAISTGKKIKKAKAGIVIRYNKKELVDAVVKLLQDEKLLNEYRKNALRYVQQFDYAVVYEKNLNRVLSK